MVLFVYIYIYMFYIYKMAVKVEKQVPQASAVAPVAGELDFCFDFCFCGWLLSGRCAGKKRSVIT